MTGTVDFDYYRFNQGDIDASAVNEARLATLATALDGLSAHLAAICQDDMADPAKTKSLQERSRQGGYGLRSS